MLFRHGPQTNTRHLLCINIYLYIQTYVHRYSYTYMHTCVCIYTYTYIYIHTCTMQEKKHIIQTWPTDKHTIFAMYIYTYIYPYMYIHIHIHVSTYILVQRRRKAHYSDMARRHTHDIRLQPLCVSTTRGCATDQPLERQEPTRARKGVAVSCSVCCSVFQRVAACCSVR